MKSHLSQLAFGLLLLMLTSAACAQATPAKPDFFPDADMMRIGVYYYPEAWPAEQ